MDDDPNLSCVTTVNAYLPSHLYLSEKHHQYLILFQYIYTSKCFVKSYKELIFIFKRVLKLDVQTKSTCQGASIIKMRAVGPTALTHSDVCVHFRYELG